MIERLLADADLNRAIVSGVIRRNSEVDFKRAEDVPLEGLHDEAVLDVAAQDGRVLVSHDISTMPNHFRDYIRGRTSPGVILSSSSATLAKPSSCMYRAKTTARRRTNRCYSPRTPTPCR